MIEYQALVGLSDEQILARVKSRDFLLPTAHCDCDEERIRRAASGNRGKGVATKRSFLEKLVPPTYGDKSDKYILLTANFESTEHLDDFTSQLQTVWGYKVVDYVVKDKIPCVEVASVR